jgi:hypothetical protein
VGRTKDESFMLRLYEEASKQADVEEPLNRYHIGQLIGLQKKATDTICQTLMQTNFIKKQGLEDISLTPHGIKLIEQMKGKNK